MGEPEEERKRDFKSQVEALLFASGRFMDYDALMGLTGATSKEMLTNSIAKLKQEYDERGSPLMVVEEKDGWKLTVREKYLPIVRKIVSETELPKTILETLAVIAWKSPVLQSEIVDIRHNKAYEHIAELEELGFIKKEPHGRSQMLRLTEKFYEYFDVEGAKNIREVFSKVVGKQDQSKVDDFESKMQGPANPEPLEDVNEEPLQQEKESETDKKDKKEEEFSELD